MKNQQAQICAAKSDCTRSSGSRRPVLLTLPVAILLAGMGAAQAQSRHVIANNTLPNLAQAQDLGPEDAAKSMTVTAWLHSQARPAGGDSPASCFNSRQGRGAALSAGFS